MRVAGSRRLLLVAAIAALLVLPGAGRSQLAHAATGPGQTTTGALRICTNCVQQAGDLSHYDYVILNSWDAPMIPALKAKNPNLKALVYKNLSFTVSYTCSGGADNARLPTGVGYCDANSNHADWFLTDPGGARINSRYFTQHWLMDVGNPAYQNLWRENVAADLRAGGWDGVFADDTDASIAWHLGSRTIARYPNDAAWRAATRSMLANVGPALRSSGFLVVPNLSAPWASNYDAQATWRDWIQFTSGAAQEYYTKWGTTSSSWFAGSDWTYRQQFQAITEQAGKIFLGITYAPKSDVRSMQYARANFLLFHEPRNGGALIFEATDPEAQDPFAAHWTSDVGEPKGARFQAGAAWRRNFTGGTVLVNPSSSTVTVQLGGSYLLQNGSSVTSLTLGPTSGAVLRAAGGTQPPLPPAPPASSPIVLGAVASGGSVKLSWSGMSAGRSDVFRNGTRIASVANHGTYVDRLGRKAKGTRSYRVCAAGTTTCSKTVSVKVWSSIRSAAGSRRGFAVRFVRSLALHRRHASATHRLRHR
jgi:hypothetical protein